MALSFNVTGPCFADEHYMVPPERRLGRVLELIENRKYFSLTGGRQTGKTTSLFWLVQHLNATGRHRAIWVDLQTAREKPDPAVALKVVLEKIDRAVALKLPEVTPRPDVERLLGTPATALERYLGELAERCPLPLVVLFDEVDGLVGEAMVSFLTQLREGYIARKEARFPHSVVLVGMRQVRDYVVSSEERNALSWLGTTSPFNITYDALTLDRFSRQDVEELLLQHTQATGQVFEPEAVERIWDLSQGHPWLVNALADQIVARDLRDPSIAITREHVDLAKETIILQRRTHIDSLMARLREPRVRSVIDPMIAGAAMPPDMLDDDLSYVASLGLIRLVAGTWEIANPIYREVIPRTLNQAQQTGIRLSSPAFVRADGSLDVDQLMTAWQAFWREDGHLAAEGFLYRESGPHLVMMAFLQRILNGGGRIEREYGIGRHALDLLVCWKEERHAIELKIRRSTETEERALGQVARYLDGLGLAEGWLVMFDQRSTRSWEERLFRKTVDFDGKRLFIVGC